MNNSIDSAEQKRISPMNLPKKYAIAYMHDIGTRCKGDILSRHTTYAQANKLLRRNPHARYLEIIELS